ncbi:glycosyl transferase [Candidatus Dependentiae bacterium HGW-Dependentiae-1]|nr:MAG: glycosyl transferase [Candidatus Dependentiae bacterium HGW-Dependentiae-1]
MKIQHALARYYHAQRVKWGQFIIPADSAVLHIGCQEGDLLAALKPFFGVGIDADGDAIAAAQKNHGAYFFYQGDVRALTKTCQFDYILVSLLAVGDADIQELLQLVQPYCHARTRVLLECYSYLWEPLLWFGQKLGLRKTTGFKHWIARADLDNFLYLAGYQVVTQGQAVLMPVYIPVVSWVCNALLAPLPIIRRLCLQQWLVARPMPRVQGQRQVSVSVIVPCKNEKGNIQAIVERCPEMGSSTELIFVEGGSRDGTQQEIERVIQEHPEKKIRLFVQEGKGKGDAVRKGFAHATGDVLMILDADMTVAPEELPRFFELLVSGKAEFVNGSRLVYAMESDAMRFLNLTANFFFSVLFSWLLAQRVKDTLCGTKVLWAQDYKKIAANRAFFGTLDPFGDFDLLFGAAKLQLKIVDLPIHYKSRVYGQTQIRRFYHGLILLKMSMRGVRKFKMR